jgi:hypothetical protein
MSAADTNDFSEDARMLTQEVWLAIRWPLAAAIVVMVALFFVWWRG